jgi:PKD repeat protein
VPSAKVGGKPVSSVAPNVEVAFSSKVTQANTKSVEWDFGDGTAPEKRTNQYQTTEATHKFTKEGSFTVTETVESDNLSNPTLTQSIKLTVEVAHPVAQFSANPGEPKVGQTVTFDGKNSTDPNSEPLEYAWNFGDGTPPTSFSTAPTITHAFGAEAKYTVTLTVKDKAGLSGETKHVISVFAEKPPTPPPSGGGGGGGGTTGSGGGSSTGGSSSTGGGSTGVLPYSVSLAGTALAVSKSGTLALKVNCSGKSNCSGSVTLRTLTAVSAGKKRKAVLTLASGSFTLAGGQVKAVSLHLSSKARQLLKRSHILKARATIVAKDSQGTSHTTTFVVTLRAVKAKH